jgi:hypothetical protein
MAPSTTLPSPHAASATSQVQPDKDRRHSAATRSASSGTRAAPAQPSMHARLSPARQAKPPQTPPVRARPWKASGYTDRHPGPSPSAMRLCVPGLRCRVRATDSAKRRHDGAGGSGQTTPANCPNGFFPWLAISGCLPGVAVALVAGLCPASRTPGRRQMRWLAAAAWLARRATSRPPGHADRAEHPQDTGLAPDVNVMF